MVEEFLQDLPFGAVGSDVGCGNGKYLDVKSDLWIIGNDQCENLLRLASHSHSSDLAVVNNLSLPFVDACLVSLKLFLSRVNRFLMPFCITGFRHQYCRDSSSGDGRATTSCPSRAGSSGNAWRKNSRVCMGLRARRL